MNGHKVSIGIGRAAVGAIIILLVFLLGTVNRNLHIAQEDNQRLTAQIAEQQAAAEAREAELLAELEQLRQQVESLEEQVRQLGGNPVTETTDTNPGTPGSNPVNEEPVPQPPPPPVVSNPQPAPEPDPPVVRDESSGPVNEILDTVDELVCTVPLVDC